MTKSSEAVLAFGVSTLHHAIAARRGSANRSETSSVSVSSLATSAPPICGYAPTAGPKYWWKISPKKSYRCSLIAAPQISELHPKCAPEAVGAPRVCSAELSVAPTPERPCSVVDVRRWVGEGEIPGALVWTRQIAMLDGDQVGAGAAWNQLGNCHATLPGAVRLDGSIALADNGSPILAARAGRRRYGDQLCGHQPGNRSSADAALHGCLPSHRRWGVAEFLGWQIPSTAQPATNDATACVTGLGE